MAIAIHHSVRHVDEWSDEPDEVDRAERPLESIDEIDVPMEAAGTVAYRVTRAQAFAEANKRIALLVARWILDRNGLCEAALLPSDDRQVADLVKTASRQDAER